MWIFPAVGMGLSSSRKQLFPAGSTYVHVLLKWSTSCLNQIIQSAYTAWSSNHYWNEMGMTMMFQCIMQLEYTCTVRLSCDVTMFWNLIGTANFLAAEVTVWIRRSCQAISSTAWEIGMRPLKCFLTSTRSWGCRLSLATCSLLPRQQDKQRGNFPEFKLYTDVTSRQSHYLRISEYQTSARVGYDFPAVENWVFLCNARTSSERGGVGL